MSLLPHEAQIWLTNPDDVRDPSLLEAYMDLLDDEERARHARFIPERVKHDFLVAHALVRTALSGYATVAPRQWSFVANQHGRPDISHPSVDFPLRFNLSHTRGLVALAVMAGHDVGVDVEHIHRRTQAITIADRFFAQQEVQELHALPQSAQRDRFFDYWTLKESYIKARGMGLALPLGKFAFQLEEGRHPRIHIDPSLEDDAGQWQFRQQSPTPEHRLALAVRDLPPGELRVKTRWVTPLC